MPRRPTPKTEREWEDWHREQKGLPPLPTQAQLAAKDAERKRKEAARSRTRRTRDANMRMKQPKVKLAPVVDLKTKAPQPDKASQMTHAKPPAPESPEPKPMGRNELAWQTQCADFADSNPAIVATILTLASVLDDPDRSAMWPTTSRQIQSYYVQLTGGKRKRKANSRLAAVARMSSNTRKAAQ